MKEFFKDLIFWGLISIVVNAVISLFTDSNVSLIWIMLPPVILALLSLIRFKPKHRTRIKKI